MYSLHYVIIVPLPKAFLGAQAVRPVPRAEAEAARRLPPMTFENEVANCSRRDALTLAIT